MRILLSTNGTEWADRALETGTQVALAAGSSVDILAAAPSPDRLKKASKVAVKAADHLEAASISVAVIERLARLGQEVISQAATSPYELVVLGSRGRHGVSRILMGSLAAHVVGHVPSSVLVIKGRRRDLARFLVCTAAGPVSDPTVHFAGKLAGPLGASVTLLHVLSQLPVTSSASVEDLEASARSLLKRRTREGRHLSRVLESLTADGVSARLVVRHGLIVDEIVAEMEEGHFDLLVIGAHVTPGIKRPWANNLAEQALLRSSAPVLVVRQTTPEA